MNKLSNQSVIQICASQVIVSLDSALKELIENGIDASSDLIEIKLVEYGVETITVIGTNLATKVDIDNGSGISKENHDSFGQRHHTSKIHSFEDTRTVNTFGFRGEAVNSLCALGNVEIITCTDPPMGYKLRYDHAGQVVASLKIARSRGSMMI